MTVATHQMNVWSGTFGKEYTDRSIVTSEEHDEHFIKTYGVTKTSMNEEFLGSLDRNIRILEVGCNIGVQLECLQKMGFTNLYGIELQPYAVEIALSRLKGVNIIQGTALDIPFKNNFFDLVYSAGVLIHISPNDIKTVMSEMIRCSKQYIWGFEYYNDNYMEVDYRGHENLLWKGDFAKIFQEVDPMLQLKKEKHYPYLHTPNTDSMYLLEKS